MQFHHQAQFNYVNIGVSRFYHDHLLTLLLIHRSLSMYRSRAYYPISTIAPLCGKGRLVSGNGGRVSHDLSSISLSMCRALEEGGGIVADVTNCRWRVNRRRVYARLHLFPR